MRASRAQSPTDLLHLPAQHPSSERCSRDHQYRPAHHRHPAQHRHTCRERTGHDGRRRHDDGTPEQQFVVPFKVQVLRSDRVLDILRQTDSISVSWEEFVAKKAKAKKTLTGAQALRIKQAAKEAPKLLKDLNLDLKKLEKEIGILVHDPYICGPPKPKK
jgi:hypothetical protein